MINPDQYSKLIEEAQRAKDHQRAAQLELERDSAQTSIEVRILSGQVVLAFGENVKSIGMTPRLAREIATGLDQAADMLDAPTNKPLPPEMQQRIRPDGQEKQPKKVTNRQKRKERRQRAAQRKH